VVSFTLQPLYPRERVPGIRWIGGWVGPRAVLDAVMKRKIPSPSENRTLEPRTSYMACRNVFQTKAVLLNEISILSCVSIFVTQTVLDQVLIDFYVKQYYEGVSKSFRTGHLEREVQTVQQSATRCSCSAIF
jgi:hypothetical protein